jgi:hypothetical protein
MYIDIYLCLDTVDTQIWQKPTQARQVGQIGSSGRSDQGVL